jgi:hypothetical protein
MDDAAGDVDPAAFAVDFLLGGGDVGVERGGVGDELEG